LVVDNLLEIVWKAVYKMWRKFSIFQKISQKSSKVPIFAVCVEKPIFNGCGKLKIFVEKCIFLMLFHN
jgi:hypothetical protein